MPTAVVTGANSGVGWKFAEKLIDEGYTVYACDIHVGDRLSQLKTPHRHQLDVTSPDSIEAFRKVFGSQPLDLLLNIAGVMAPTPLDSLTTVTLPTLTKTFSTNTFGPLLLTQALLPALLLSKSAPKVANVSSRVGSMGDNSSGGSYAYRASKAALNAISKSMAVDLKERGIAIVILHPGIVKTGMVPDSSGIVGAVEPEVAIEGLWEVLRGKGLDETGRFWHRSGEELPW